MPSESNGESGSTPEPITLALTGDVMLGRLVNQAIGMLGFDYPWGNMLPELHRADLRQINLECAMTDRTERWDGDPEKPFFFGSYTRNVETLRIARIDFASLANNHIGDFGPEGLLDTISTLDSAGIANAGAGPNLTAAREPARLATRGCRVTVVAFADHPEEWAATPDNPGLNFCRPASDAPADFEPVKTAIEDAREDTDLLVFTIHWGPNWRLRPPPEFRRFAHRVIGTGVDIFWGHSAHIVQGIEMYRDKPIFYDTGDFIDDYATDPALRNDLSALFRVQSQPPDITNIELIPVHISNLQVNRAVGANREWFKRRITVLCREMGTTVVDKQDRLVVTWS